ncbi:hypothetical protein M595_5573 [Lyngbya aestuarii BL J]|uniref:Uncharacterized protein n=1 Tax=Lyngbya aestuarii BL J TaxID=1348334 RepID=U7QBC7_9CYAN|nr:hypothetical protein M595_5573 [Lyngbya aestuarii BL J]
MQALHPYSSQNIIESAIKVTMEIPDNIVNSLQLQSKNISD